jgi:hypothetical protein
MGTDIEGAPMNANVFDWFIPTFGSESSERGKGIGEYFTLMRQHPPRSQFGS